MKNKGLILAMGALMGVLTTPANALSLATSYTLIDELAVSFSPTDAFFSGFSFSNDAASDGISGEGNADRYDAPAACIGACASFENEFYQHTQTADTAYGDAQVISAGLSVGTGAASSIGEVITGAGIAYASGANVFTGYMFGVAPGTEIDFSFNAELFMNTVAGTDGFASANSFFNISLRNSSGATVFEWLPDGSSVTGPMGGTELYDPFSLNTGITFNSLYDQSADFFRASTNALAGGSYRLNIKMENKVNAFDVVGPNVVVPLPAAAWLFASGLVGLFATSRRKK
ncbi:MAG: hypothetical protein GXP22_05935 [Gammaproteobacteria bacterium]|nr:hypothetical protein [Gammaproteobacteria bacterium]